MTTPKRLSLEEVDTALEMVDGEDRQRVVVGKAAIRGHIAALEAEIDHAQAVNLADLRRHEQHTSELEKSLENARKERDEARQTARANANRTADVLIERDAALSERDEAVADNAALVMAATMAAAELRHTYGNNAGGFGPIDPNLVARAIRLLEGATAQPHPGAALLEEHRKEIDRWQENVETVKGERDVERRLRLEQGEALAACQQHVRETGDDHRKALVRARNEGLEKAAEHGDFATTYAEKKARRSTMTDVERASWTLAARLARDMAAAILAMKEPEPT